MACAVNCRKSFACCKSAIFLQFLKSNILFILILCSVIGGTVIGVAFKRVSLPYKKKVWITIWGELYMRMLKLIILPLVMTSMITGVASLKGSLCRKVGGATIAYIMLTQLLATLVGLCMSLAIRPGHRLELSPVTIDPKENSFSLLAADFIRNMVPDNIITASFEHGYTSEEQRPVFPEHADMNNTFSTINAEEERIQYKFKNRLGTNMFGIILFSLVLGIGINHIGERAELLLKVTEALNQVVISIMNVVLWYSPIGICSLVAGALLSVGNVSLALLSLLFYILTVFVGLVLYSLVVLPLGLLPILRLNVWKYVAVFSSALLTSFGASSSAAALPYLLRDGVKKAGADPRIVGFVAPIAVSLNRDGGAVFLIIAVLFAAQANNVDLSASDYFILIIFVTIIITTVPGVPSSSLVVLTWVCETMGIPSEECLGLIISTEWLVDRMRTPCNVLSQGLGIVFVDHVFGKRLMDLEDVFDNEEQESLQQAQEASGSKCSEV